MSAVYMPTRNFNPNQCVKVNMRGQNWVRGRVVKVNVANVTVELLEDYSPSFMRGTVMVVDRLEVMQL